MHKHISHSESHPGRLTSVDVEQVYACLKEDRPKDLALEGRVIYGTLSMPADLTPEEVKEPEDVGWYRIFKRGSAWFFESFLGEPRDEAMPLWSTSLKEAGFKRNALASFYSFISVREDNNLASSDPVAYLAQCAQHAVFDARLRYRFRKLFSMVPSLDLVNAGGMCPFQADGYIEGLPFYFRFRHDMAHLRVADKIENIFDKPLYESMQEYGDGSGYSGYLTEDEFADVFVNLLRNLQRAPITWTFEGEYTRALYPHHKVGAPSSMRARGHTADEAWRALHEVSDDESGDDDSAGYAEYVAAHGLRPDSTTVDDRVFPEQDPDFNALIVT